MTNIVTNIMTNIMTNIVTNIVTSMVKNIVTNNVATYQKVMYNQKQMTKSIKSVWSLNPSGMQKKWKLGKKKKNAERNERQREKYHRLKEELKRKIELPEFERSEYELFCENKIIEREESMNSLVWLND